MVGAGRLRQTRTGLHQRACDRRLRLLQQLIAGGVITVVAPLAVTQLGLPLWSGLCLVLVLLWIVLALLLAGRAERAGPAA